jgi:FAD/FMN-containing dehydrogenase
LEEALNQGLIQDAVPAESATDIDRFWTIREDVAPMVAKCQHIQQFDISLPIPLIGEILNQIVKELYRIPEVEKVFTFGHVGDGNIHLVIGKGHQSEALINRINDRVYQPLTAIGGSISAEHGIGVHKKNYLHISRSPEEIQLMKTLKHTLDPHNILNPGKVLDLM